MRAVRTNLKSIFRIDIYQYKSKLYLQMCGWDRIENDLSSLIMTMGWTPIISWMSWYLKSKATELFDNSLCGLITKETSKLCIIGPYERNSLVTGGFPSQRASNTVSMSMSSYKLLVLSYIQYMAGIVHMVCTLQHLLLVWLGTYLFYPYPGNISLALGQQSHYCPQCCAITMQNRDKLIAWIPGLWYNNIKHNKSMWIFHGIYSIYITRTRRFHNLTSWFWLTFRSYHDGIQGSQFSPYDPANFLFTTSSQPLYIYIYIYIYLSSGANGIIISHAPKR